MSASREPGVVVEGYLKKASGEDTEGNQVCMHWYESIHDAGGQTDGQRVGPNS